MDFVVGLPLTRRKHDLVWVVVGRLTKTTYFLPVRTDYSLDKLAERYIKEIVRLHGIPISIISDRDPSYYIVVWIVVDEFLYKGNDEVSKKLLSKNFQNPCFCFGYKLSYNHPN